MIRRQPSAGLVLRCLSPRMAAALTAAVLLPACAGRAPPPQPGQSRSLAPDLRGSRVMLLPVQLVSGVPGDPYAELAFALSDRGREVEWVLEDEVAAVLARSPAIRATTRGLPVGLFLQAEVERVGDPLYGELRRMAALVEVDAILLPIQASWEANQDVEGSTPRVRLSAALIVPRSGDVLWFGMEEGGDFPLGDPRGLASAVEALARTLLWYVPD